MLLPTKAHIVLETWRYVFFWAVSYAQGQWYIALVPVKLDSSYANWEEYEGYC